MVREFKYRGYTVDQLQNMSFESLLSLIPSRQRRSLNRGISEGKRKLLEEVKAAREGRVKEPIKTHERDMPILPYMVGLTIHVHNGKEFIPLAVKPEMIGHYLGEYVLTIKKVAHGTPGIGASRSSLYVPLK